METYRESVEALVRRRDELKEERARELRQVTRAPGVFKRRVARIAFGATLTAFALAMILAIAVPFFFTSDRSFSDLAPMFMLLGWPAAILAAFIARTVAALRRAGHEPVLPVSNDVREEIRALQALSVDEVACAPARRLESWSVALPLIGLALLAPLTLHFGVAELLWGPMTLDRYEGWIAMSLAIVGHAHLSIVVAAIVFARALRATPIWGISRLSRSYGFWAYGIAVACSCIPGIVFMAIPTVISAVTGILFVPWMFILLGGRLLNEREALTIDSSDEEAAPAIDPPLAPSVAPAAVA